MTATTQRPEAAPHHPGRRWVWVAVASAVALTVAVAAMVVGCGDGDDSGPPEPTAWDNRAELDRVLRETADAAGITTTEEPVSEGSLPCERNDGRSGSSYFLQTLTAPGPVADADAILDAVAEQWDGLGYTVDSSLDGAVTALTPDGAVLQAAASQMGARLGGETLCARQDGAPD